ncbi:thiamine pyrophosphate-binding protein [Rhodococcus koreensis]
MRLFEGLGQAFVTEGTSTLFGVMGDANMAWVTHMASQGVRIVHARHEAAAVTMADGYARRSNNVGIATVTCGPGITQIATSLVTAVRHRTPLVVFAGDTPAEMAYHVQEFEQRPFVDATGAAFVRIDSSDEAAEQVAKAFEIARHDRLPVVLSIPYDLQHGSVTGPWCYQQRPVANSVPIEPDAETVAHVASLLEAAERPVMIVGRGAIAANAREEVLALAERTGALLGTTWPARGWFDDNPWDLGLVGGFGADRTQDLVRGADLVLGIGALLSRFTTMNGALFSNATVVHLDVEPKRRVEGVDVVDVPMLADARLGITALLERLGRGPARGGYRTAEIRRRLDEPEPEPQPAASTTSGTINPYTAAAEINAAVPADWTIVLGVAHFMHFLLERLRGRHPDRYIYTYDFGAIGHALGTAIGAAAASNEPTLCIEGDGSLLMNMQELETLARHRLPVLVLVFNDGQYAAEAHKLRSMDLPTEEAVFGMPNLAGVAGALELDAHTVTQPDQLRTLIQGFARDPRPTLVDLRIDPNIICRDYLRDLFPQDGGEQHRAQ